MKENQVSFTAMMVAYMRAYHAMNNTDKIFDDFLAYYLISEEKRTLIEQHFEQYFTGYTQLNGSEYSCIVPRPNSYLSVLNASNQCYQSCAVCGRRPR